MRLGTIPIARLTVLAVAAGCGDDPMVGDWELKDTVLRGESLRWPYAREGEAALYDYDGQLVYSRTFSYVYEGGASFTADGRGELWLVLRDGYDDDALVYDEVALQLLARVEKRGRWALFGEGDPYGFGDVELVCEAERRDMSCDGALGPLPLQMRFTRSQ